MPYIALCLDSVARFALVARATDVAGYGEIDFVRRCRMGLPRVNGQPGEGNILKKKFNFSFTFSFGFSFSFSSNLLYNAPKPQCCVLQHTILYSLIALQLCSQHFTTAETRTYNQTVFHPHDAPWCLISLPFNQESEFGFTL